MNLISVASECVLNSEHASGCGHDLPHVTLQSLRVAIDGRCGKVLSRCAVCQDTARIAMLETALIAFTTYFATIGPADVAALFAALTPTTRRPSGVRWRSRAR
jgi:hypothetical protein